MTTFAEAFNPKSNSIGFLRLALALLVIVSHDSLVNGQATDGLGRLSDGQETLGLLAVHCFFALSGYLLAASYAQGNHLGHFVWRRLARLFPGYWVCLIVTAAVIAPLCYHTRHGSFAGYLSAPTDSPWGYVGGNWFMRIAQWDIAGATRGLPYPDVLNGSLWTLKYELVCYLLIAAVGAGGLLRSRFVLPAIAVGMQAATCAHLVWPEGSLLDAIPLMEDDAFTRLAAMFFTGSLWFRYGDRIRLRPLTLAAALLLLAGALALGSGYQAILPLLSYPLFYAAARWPVRSFDRRVDLSYGVYVYAFPIAQLLALRGLTRYPSGVQLALTILIVLPVAAASYFLIERPALRLRPGDVVDWLRRLVAGRDTLPPPPRTKGKRWA